MAILTILVSQTPTPNAPSSASFIPNDQTATLFSEAGNRHFQSVIDECNKFTGDLRDLWAVYICGYPKPIGYMRDSFRRAFDWEGTGLKFYERECGKPRIAHLLVDCEAGEEGPVEACRRQFVNMCTKNTHDAGCKKWLGNSLVKRDYHPVRGLLGNLQGLKVPSPLRGIIGIATSGTHMNMFTVKRVAGRDQIHIWVSRRSQNVTYAGKLDQVVAGAMSPEDGMDDLETLGREAEEEAGLLLDRGTLAIRAKKTGKLVGRVRRGSQVTFFDQKDRVAGSEEGHLEPGIRFTYDLQVDPWFVPEPAEPESIDGFHLKSVESIRQDLLNAEWKPNCGLVMLDFLLRRRLLLGDVDAEVDVDGYGHGYGHGYMDDGQLAGLTAGLQRELHLDVRGGVSRPR
jgi:8-oxo-dGTP pyrophosphatase MutT (NUDIX family)